MKNIPPPMLKIPLRDGFTFDMVYVEGGEFMMGDNDGKYDDEKPAHPVKLNGFYMGKYPVTQALWQAIKGENPSKFKGENRPVDTVSWLDAQDFIEKLNTALSFPKGIRLPTEAEWEFAARGGKSSESFKYAGSDYLDEVGWYAGNSYNETKPVGLKLPNELGIYDMSGNVWEWCEDWFDSDYYKKCATEGLAMNPLGPERGHYRVQRGGSYFNKPDFCRAASRDYWPPEYRDYDIGFRLALSPQFSP